MTIYKLFCLLVSTIRLRDEFSDKQFQNFVHIMIRFLKVYTVTLFFTETRLFGYPSIDVYRISSNRGWCGCLVHREVVTMKAFKLITVLEL